MSKELHQQQTDPDACCTGGDMGDRADGDQPDQGCWLPDEAELQRRFTERYRRGEAEVVAEFERAVFGIDYGCSSWTDLDEARSLAVDLELAPGVSLLEVGSGAGWPGLFLASSSGCAVTLTDLPLTGLRRARVRAAAEGLDGRCRVVAANGRRLPFADHSFDAVVHSDVLCCLPAKSAVLHECRRVVGRSGRMAWSAIEVPEGLDASAHAAAVAAGPTFVDTTTGYPELLAETGWKVELTTDVTAEWRDRVERYLLHLELLGDRLEDVHGTDGIADLRRSRLAYRSAVDAGLLRRRVHFAVPATVKSFR